jgi:hypothetical protein
MKIEPYPLTWPEGWPRTLLRDRQKNGQWKDTLLQSLDKLRKEMAKMKSLSFVISCNIPPSGPVVDDATGKPLNYKFQDVPAPADTGVAVWFSRQQKDDYSWQETLHIPSPAPSEKEIWDAFKKYAAQYHPDNLRTGDVNIYMRYDEAKKRALRFIARKTGAEFQQCVAIDVFEEVKWNLRAVQMSLGYMRGLENCGGAAILERAMESFIAIPEKASATSTT